MDELYTIIYTEPAVTDLEEKARYISIQLRSPATAMTWYQRLRKNIQEDLSFMPHKYLVWRERGGELADLRLAMYRNDVILYSVDEQKQIVYIRAIRTSGQNFTADLE